MLKNETVCSQNNRNSQGSSRIDSIRTALKSPARDTNRVKCLNYLGWEIKGQDPDSSIALSKQALLLSQKLDFLKGVAQSYHHIGLYYFLKGNYPLAMQYYESSISVCERLEKANRSGNELQALKSKTLGYMGLVYSNQGNVLKALDYYITAIKIDEKIGNKLGIARHSGNIGIIYFQRGNIPKAKEYYLKALKLAEETGYRSLQANTYGNLGLLYFEQNDKTNALDYYNKALQMADEEGYKLLQANTLGNIGDVYKKSGTYDKALDHYHIALKIKQELGDLRESTITLKSIGEVYLEQKKYAEAENYFKQALRYADTLLNYELMMNAHNLLSAVYFGKKDYKGAYLNYVAAIRAKDSVTNEQKQKEITRKEMEFEYYKKAAQDSVRNAEEKKTIAAKVLARDEQLKRASTQRYALIGGCVLMLVFGGFMYSRFKITHRQKKIIELQKTEVEVKNKEILDSITYAKRLQEAILPDINAIKKYLPESFVFYKPKDIVAGDFYYFEHAVSGNDDVLFLAAADCTGHGVPGALVSVVCSNALNRCIKEMHIGEPGKILDKTRDLVLETFTKSSQDVKDGMDISLTRIRSVNTNPENKLQKGRLVIPKGQSLSEVLEGNKKYKVDWAGANNSLWYIQNNEFKELDPNKQPIGKTENPNPFSTHTIELGKGDMLYLFTDGYADQFGGPKKKKFKYKPLKELLAGIHALPAAEQGKILEQKFAEWRGDLEQVDDVCIIGVRI